MTQNASQQIQELIRAGEYNRAVQACLDGLAARPDDAELRIQLAICEGRRGNVGSAREQLAHVLSDEPEHPGALFELGDLLLAGGRQDEAAEALRKCVELDPNHASARAVLARIALHQDRLAEARSGFRTALRADPDHELALLGLAEVLLRSGEADAAREIAGRALKAHPASALAQLTMARAFEACNHPDFAEQCLRNASAQAPEDVRFVLELAALLQRQNRHEEALDALAGAEQRNPADRAVPASRALSLMCTGRLQEAGEIYERLVIERPEREFFLQLADLYHEQSDGESLEALLALAEGQPEALQQWLKALATAVGGKVDTALEHVRALIAEDDNQLAIQARLLAAGLLLAADRSDEVEEFLRPLAGVETAPGSILWEAARMCRSAGFHRAAGELLDRILEGGSLDEKTRQQVGLARLDAMDRAGLYAEVKAVMPQVACKMAPFPLHIEKDGREPVDFQSDLAALAGMGWGGAKPDTPFRGPVFIHGFPGSGGDALIKILEQCSDALILPIAEWPRRHRALQLPTAPRQLPAFDQTRLDLMRHRYLRGHRQRAGVRLVEPAFVSALSLPALARVFPDATFIVMQVSEESLELHWRLNGYRDVPEMLRFWHREREILARLRDLVPMQCIELALTDLMLRPGETFSAALADLEMSPPPELSKRAMQLFEDLGYRPPDHWRHYADLFGDVPG